MAPGVRPDERQQAALLTVRVKGNSDAEIVG